MSDTLMPGIECDSCGFLAQYLISVRRRSYIEGRDDPDSQHLLLCEVCNETVIATYTAQYPNEFCTVLRAMAGCTNLILAAIRASKS